MNKEEKIEALELCQKIIILLEKETAECEIVLFSLGHLISMYCKQLGIKDESFKKVLQSLVDDYCQT